MSKRRNNLSSNSGGKTNGRRSVKRLRDDDEFDGFDEKLPSSWRRPDIIKGNGEGDGGGGDLSMQCIDMDMTVGDPLPTPTSNTTTTTGATAGTAPEPIIRAYGVTDGGRSVCALIRGYTPYGYFALPPEVKEVLPHRLGDIRMYLDGMLRKNESSSDPGSAVKGLSLLDRGEYRSLLGYVTPHTRFLKVYVSVPTLIPPLKRLMEEGVALPGVVLNENVYGKSVSYPPFECNVPFVLRYMIDRSIVGGGWLTFPKGTYTLRRPTPAFHEADDGESRPNTSHCQLELDIDYRKVVSHPPRDEWSRLAPLRILSLDIECQGRAGHFPEAQQDPVIQIACVLSTSFSPKSSDNDDENAQSNNANGMTKIVFTLNGCLPIVGAKVVPCQTERSLLMRFQKYWSHVDPDIITGYNVQNFDLPYLLDRADALDLPRTFRYWGRIQHRTVSQRQSTFQSAAYGRRTNVELTLEGRVVFDMLPYMQRNHKLSSYTLNNVCTEFLGQQKEDVHHSIISTLQQGTDQDRHRLATYCLKDALLPLLLMDKLSVLVNSVEMARVTGVPVDYLIGRGQQIKVFSMILRKCRDEKLLVPTLSKSGANMDNAYEGATVLEPIRAYYRDHPIATLDFASLYPSIMQAYNLCYSTLLSPRDAARMNSSDYQTSPPTGGGENGQQPQTHAFVKTSVRRGVLPTILSELLAARKRAKKDMKAATNDFDRAVQNGRQLALKVSANSVYGFTGAGVGQLPCLPVASSVTGYGRTLLEKTKAFVEDQYRVSNGYKHDAKVIYGDTDSVMVKFGTTSVADTFPLAEDAAQRCSQLFPDPILLEFEKIYFPYLLMNKKRYAGLMWTHPDKHDAMDTKGLETVRRDNCALVREVVQASLDKIIIHKDVPGAVAYVKAQIADLLQNKMDISRLVITKSLNKGAEYALGLPNGKKEDYKVKQAHVELAARMKKRDPGSAPQMGDRVPYVMITGAKGAANFEKSEDPIYVLENNLTLDCRWYLTNQLSKPLCRIFEPILGASSEGNIDEAAVERELMQGEHTRVVVKPTPTAKAGNLLMFAKTLGASCLTCRTKIPAGKAICDFCVKSSPSSALPAAYLKQVDALREAEIRYARLWSGAQRVHGTVHSPIMCTGDGCACLFYRRRKVQNDVAKTLETIARFGPPSSSPACVKVPTT